MKISATSFSKKTSTTEKIGTLTFKAQNEVDAVQLAALFDQWHGHKGRIKQMREECLRRFCKENNVTISWNEND